jgi:molybdopterin converting factor small subunit
MAIKVLCFGATADAVGSRELEILFSESITAGSVIKQLPALSNHKLLIAVNEEYADADTVLNDGDEVALFTAVSGG